MAEEPTPTDARILAVLEQILAAQTEFLALLRQNGEAGLALSNESLALQRQAAENQRQAAERQALALETQRKVARLYRGVVTVAGIIVLGGVALIIAVFLHG